MADESNKKDGKTCACGCGSCGCTGGMWYGKSGGYMLIRIVIALIILFVVFAIGVKIGELQSALGHRFGGYGHGNMMMRGGYGGYGYGMMGGGYGQAIPPVPVNGAATSTLK